MEKKLITVFLPNAMELANVLCSLLIITLYSEYIGVNWSI